MERKTSNKINVNFVIEEYKKTIASYIDQIKLMANNPTFYDGEYDEFCVTTFFEVDAIKDFLCKILPTKESRDYVSRIMKDEFCDSWGNMEARYRRKEMREQLND